MVRQGFALGGGGDFGHDEQAADNGAGELIELPKLAMPGFLSLDQRRDPTPGDNGPAKLVAREGNESGEVVQADVLERTLAEGRRG